MDFTILNNHLAAWGIALAIALAATMFLHTAKGMVVSRLQAYAPTTATYLDDLAITILSAATPLFMPLMGIWAGSNWLALSDKFEVVYIVQTPHYGVYMDVQQAINLAVFDRFAEEGIEFAIPAQAIHLSRPTQGADANA